MTTLLLAFAIGYGVHLVYSAVAFGWDGVRPGPAIPSVERRKTSSVATQLGLGELDVRAIAGAMAALGIAGFVFGLVLFAGVAAGVVLGVFAATLPVGVARLQHQRRVTKAHEAWPAIIEEIRLLTSTLGRSIPQATFEAGQRAPEGLRPAFDAAHREWMISTDFVRSLQVLKDRLEHNTADIVAETLLTAHELGGGEVGRRLKSLADDRLTDQQHRRDAAAKQAGVRFARWFVLIVPLGMAFVSLSIGNGRAAYQSSIAQALVVFALLLVIGFWIWAGQIMKLPKEKRVFP